MNLKKSIAYFLHNLREKHRVSIRNLHSDREVWYMYISPLNLLAGFLALILVLFIIITTTVAYTPILDLIPGYPGNKSRTLLIENIVRLDSLEQEIRNMQIYSENISLIMAGKNPVTRNNVTATDTSKKNNSIIASIVEDSILRSQMERAGGIYSLNDPQVARRSLRSPLRGDARRKPRPAGDGRNGRNRHFLLMEPRKRLLAHDPTHRQYALHIPTQYQRSEKNGRSGIEWRDHRICRRRNPFEWHPTKHF